MSETRHRSPARMIVIVADVPPFFAGRAAPSNDSRAATPCRCTD